MAFDNLLKGLRSCRSFVLRGLGRAALTWCLLVLAAGPSTALALEALRAAKSSLFALSGRDSLWVTLGDNANIIGAVLPRVDLSLAEGELQKASEEYVRLVFGLILQSAHRYSLEVLHSHDFGDRRNVNGYWAMLLASLVVPYHESQLSHIRYARGENCVDEANTFQVANTPQGEVTDTIQTILNQFYRNPVNPLVATCDRVDKNQEVRQFLFNGTALGMWQINARYHIDAVSPEVVLNLKKHIQYGVGYLFQGDQQKSSQGYLGILSNYKKFEEACNFRHRYVKDRYTDDYQLNNEYFNLIRGLYGGQYYYGQSTVGSVCSFNKVDINADPKESNDPWVSANRKFYQSLRDVLVGRMANSSREDNGIYNQNSIYQQLLPKDSIEWRAFGEIVANFRKIHAKAAGGIGEDPYEATALQQVLAYDYLGEVEQRRMDLSKQALAATHIALAPKTKVYISPAVDRHGYCGYIDNSSGSGVPVKVLSEFDGVEDSNLPKSSGNQKRR